VIVKKISSFLYFWFPVLGYMGVIFYFSSLSQPGIPSIFPDYLLHMGEYSLLSFLIVRAVRKGLMQRKVSLEWLWGIGISLVYGISDEFHQSFVPGRSPELRDILFDFIGIILGYIFLLVVHHLLFKFRGGVRVLANK